MNKSKKKPQKWLKPRHKLVRGILGLTLGVYTKFKYNIDIKPAGERKERQYLILFNHQTAFDQFFVSMAFKKPIYFLASEDLFSKGFLSRVIKFLVNPIPIKKQTTDPRAVITCIKVAREGGTIALAPEGNRTYSGKPVHIKPSIAQLAKHLKLPIALFRIEGGYGVHPRWSDVVRGGSMRAGVSRIIEPDEYENMSDDELLTLIKNELCVDESKLEGRYPHPRQAEYLERALYYCPDCGLSRFESKNDTVKCKRCGLSVRHLDTKMLEGINRNFPYSSVAEWFDAQSEFIRKAEPSYFGEGALEEDTVELSEVILYKKKRTIAKNAELTLYRDRITLCREGQVILEIPFEDASVVTVLGKNKLNYYLRDKVYQIKGDKRLCAVKYMNLFYKFKNEKKGDTYAEFLGL